MGVGCASSVAPIKPSLETPIAAEPKFGQGRVGAVPTMTFWDGPETAAAAAGIGRRQFNAPTVTRSAAPAKTHGRPQRGPTRALGLRTALAAAPLVPRAQTYNRKPPNFA